MKKMLRGIAASLSLAAIVGFAGCSSDVQSYSSQIDTVLELSAPDVKATAYPGMNYVSWTPVANAKGYYLYVSIDGHQVDTQTFDASADLYYIDDSVKPDSVYTYRVEATSKTSTGRAVVTENAMSSAVSINSIVPDYSTKPLELYKFESGSRDTKYVVSESNINAFLDAQNKIAVTFPGKAYLKYNVYYSIDNEYETYENERAVSGELKYQNANNKTLKDTLTVTKSGTYHFSVHANAVNTNYGITDIVTADQTVEIPSLPVTIKNTNSDPNITTLAYVNPETVRMVFKGYELENGKKAPASWYKVYRSEISSPYDYTPVSGTVKATQPNNVTGTSFYVEDAIADNSTKYIYTLVVTDGTCYASNTVTKDLGVYALGDQSDSYPSIGSSVTKFDEDELNNDIIWTITLASAEMKITGVYELEVPGTEKYTPVVDDFDLTKSLASELTATSNTGYTEYKLVTKDHAVKSQSYLLVTTSQEGKKDKEVISSASTAIAKPVMSAATITVSLYDNSITGEDVAAAALAGTTVDAVKNDIILNVHNTLNAHEAIDDYTYTVYQVSPASASYQNGEAVIVWDFDDEWKKLPAFEMKLNSVDSDNKFIGIIELDDLADGLYAWKVVKADKETGEEKTSSIVFATISTEIPVSLDFEPSLYASFDYPDNAESDVTVGFKKNDTVNPVKGEGALAPYTVEYNNEVAEAGVTYTLYRTDLVEATDKRTKVVWTKITELSPKAEKDSGTVWILDETTDPANPVPVESATPKEYVDSIAYEYVDKALNTGNGYSYMVVCTKEGVDFYPTTAVKTINPRN